MVTERAPVPALTVLTMNSEGTPVREGKKRNDTFSVLNKKGNIS